MRKFTIFNHLSLDGYFVDAKGDMSWAHRGGDDGGEFNAFVASNASGESQLLFGRKTYDLMASYWPTPEAIRDMPVVANRMNSSPKIVFSRTMETTLWQNTKIVKGDLGAEVKRLKKEPGLGMVMFGSGNIVSQLALENVIDEYQFIVNPLVLGGGRTLFDGITKKLDLKLKTTRSFLNGKVFLVYEPKT